MSNYFQNFCRAAKYWAINRSLLGFSFLLRRKETEETLFRQYHGSTRRELSLEWCHILVSYKGKYTVFQSLQRNSCIINRCTQRELSSLSQVSYSSQYRSLISNKVWQLKIVYITSFSTRNFVKSHIEIVLFTPTFSLGIVKYSVSSNKFPCKGN